MGFRDKIKTMKEDLQATTQESIDRGDDVTEYGSIFIRENIPEGIQFWRPGTGEHLIDVIPYEPSYDDPKVPKGRNWFDHVDVWVHMNIGAMFDHFVCQKKAFKQADPICSYLDVAGLPTDKWKVLAPKRRTAYLIWCHDTPEEEDKGIQIWEVAWFNFKQHIDKISKNPKGGAPVNYSHVIDGKSIAFDIEESGTWTDAQGKDHPSKKFVGHRFVDRDVEIPDEFGDIQFPLDGCIKFKPTWEEQERAFPLAKSVDTPTEDTQSDDVPIAEEAKPEIKSGITPEQVEKASQAVKCPGGGTIGEDLEKLDACNKCPVWDPCSDLADELKKKPRKKEPEKPPEKKKIVRRRRRINK